MKTSNFFLLLLTLMLCFQCSSEPQIAATEKADAEVETNTTETNDTAPPPVDVEPIDTNISAAEVFEKNAERYASLHRLIVKNKNVIDTKINESTFPAKVKDGLKASFKEVAAYDNIRDMAQTSKYTSAESIEQFMKGLEMYLDRWGIK